MTTSVICYSCTILCGRAMPHSAQCIESRHATFERRVWDERIPDHWERAAPLIESERFVKPESVDPIHRGGQK